MIKKLLYITLLALHIQADMFIEGRPEVNFYTKGKLIWLIDTTPMNRDYDMLTLDDYKKRGNKDIKSSFETYLNHANTNSKYLFNDWRLPTLKELKTLEYKGGWYRKIFVSSKQVKNDLSIDKEIFYDVGRQRYQAPMDYSNARSWSSDRGPLKDGKKTYGYVNFSKKRFKEYYLYYHGSNSGRGGTAVASPIPSIKHRGGEGISFGYIDYTVQMPIRLVRDIKKSESIKEYKSILKNPHAIKKIKNPSDFLVKLAIHRDLSVLNDIKQVDKFTLFAINLDADALQYIKNKNEDIYVAYVKHAYKNIKNVKNPTEKIKIAAVKSSPYAIQYIKNPSEDVYVAYVKHNGEKIKYIDNPSEKVQLAAVKQYPYSLEYIKNPSEKVQLAAVKQNGNAINRIKEPSEKVKLAAMNNTVFAITSIKNPSKQMLLDAVKVDGKLIQYANNPSEILQLEAVMNEKRALEYIKNPSEQVQLAAVKADAYAIEYIKNPSEQVQLAAVKQDGRMIRYIKNPSEEIQLIAVKHNNAVSHYNYETIKYIKNPSEVVQLAAIENSVLAAYRIKNPSEKVQLATVKKDGHMIREFENPSEKVQLEAVKENISAINSIKNPSKAVEKYVNEIISKRDRQ